MSKQTDKRANNLIASIDEAWENGELGCSEAHVKVSDDVTEDLINEALELQPISIRLNRSLIEDLKMIADLNGLGYQPLIRQVLNRFANSEKKRVLAEAHSKAMRSEKRKSNKRHKAA
ncbi:MULTISPECIES: hypothetical protein [Photorhabdus]|uniref:Uncharacterized protein n=1 Tax=Photorhabdus hindustanensis TaxID=2918802 RepID=A0A0A0CPQ3_9GAMM|nr:MULTISPECIES: hypothetical protein [Photorhabdus]KGM26822.1 hypothetical protein KS18_17905 [Photorhabdus luminescens]MCC8456944.1 hypothetical protein [Photorhabdus aegyptia]PQQ23198.1 hypothetical protein C6H64_23015 [Photorhabdus luminescens]PQQ24951.1 hypothetical protein C6H66_13885 [Photorhabdus hindustanensis]